MIGRGFVGGDTVKGAQAVTLLSYDLWQRRFDGDPNILGRRLDTGDLEGGASSSGGPTVVGVLPRDFRMPGSPAVWLPLRLSASNSRTDRDVVAISRLKPGVGIRQAAAELSTISARLRADNKKAFEGWDATVQPLRAYLKSSASKSRFVLLAITLLVLVTGVLNVTGLLLARATARRDEFALRCALGANRARIVCQLLVEGVTLGLVGGAVGTSLSFWGTKFVVRWLGIESTGLEVGTDGRVLAFTLILALLAGLSACLEPALRASRPDLASSFRARGGPVGAAARSNHLIVAQVALGLVVLAAATILSSEYLKIRYLDLGYSAQDLYTTTASATPDQRVDGFLKWTGIVEAARAELANVPGVQAASIENVSAVKPRIVRPEEAARAIDIGTPPVKAVDPDYFSTWKTRLLAGRYFANSDRLGELPVVIANEAAAAAFWPGGQAIGRRVFVGDSGSVGELLTVVGIVKNIERGQLIERSHPVLYRPFSQAKIYAPGVTFALRSTSGVPSVLASSETVLRNATGRPVGAFRSEMDVVRRRFVAQQFNAIALTFFAGFGLLVAAMGIYASVAYSVSLRLKEIAIRTALGAEPGSVLRLFVANNLLVVTEGIVLGTLGAIAISKSLPTASRNAAPTGRHALEYFISISLMLFITMLATYLPARRGVAADPIDILRTD